MSQTPAIRGDLKGYLEKHLDAIEAVASATLTPERMVRLVCAAASRDPQLAKCTHLSILRALAQAASMGLEPFDGRNEVHLVPRWNKKANALEATCLVDYRGLIRLVTDTGKVRNIEAHPVYTKDDFELEFGMSPRLSHRPSLDRDRGEIRAVYAIAFMPDGSTTFDVMPIHEVEDIRDRAKDGKDGFSPWKTDFQEMARKTVVRRLCKYLPKSVPLARALEIQAKTEAGDFLETDVEVSRPGDAPMLSGPESSVNDDGNVVHVWTGDDVDEFNTLLDVMLDLGERAGETFEESEARCNEYRAQKAEGQDPKKVMNRVSTQIETLNSKAKKVAS